VARRSHRHMWYRSRSGEPWHRGSHNAFCVLRHGNTRASFTCTTRRKRPSARCMCTAADQHMIADQVAPGTRSFVTQPYRAQQVATCSSAASWYQVSAHVSACTGPAGPPQPSCTMQGWAHRAGSSATAGALPLAATYAAAQNYKAQQATQVCSSSGQQTRISIQCTCQPPLESMR
jgi:hypothetical protein